MLFEAIVYFCCLMVALFLIGFVGGFIHRFFVRLRSDDGNRDDHTS